MKKPIVTLFGAAMALTAANLAQAQDPECLAFTQVEEINAGEYRGGEYELSGNTVLKVSVEPHYARNAVTGQIDRLFGEARMVTTSCNKGPTAMRLTHVNLRFHIVQDRPDARQVNITYCERGPIENFSAREVDPPDLLADTPKAHNRALQDASGRQVGIEVEYEEVPGGTDGKIIYNGRDDLTDVVYGGAELEIFGFCIQ